MIIKLKKREDVLEVEVDDSLGRRERVWAALTLSRLWGAIDFDHRAWVNYLPGPDTVHVGYWYPKFPMSVVVAKVSKVGLEATATEEELVANGFAYEEIEVPMRAERFLRGEG